MTFGVYPDGPPQTTTTVDEFPLRPVFPEEYGAIGDGTPHALNLYYPTLEAAQSRYGAAAVALTDQVDGVVIQWLINEGVQIQGRAGANYLLTRGLQMITGTSCVGAMRWSAAARTMKYVGTSTLTYYGDGGTDSYVTLASTQPVGVLPTDSDTRALQNVTFTDWTLDGNDTAWYGLIEIRAAQGNDFSRLTITNCRVCHNVMELGFVTGSDKREIYLGRGAGLWSGKDVWNWAVAVTDDQISMKDWFVNYMGCDQSVNYLNQFIDNGDPVAPTSSTLDVECGASIYGSRAIRFINCQINRCGGIGVVVSPNTTGLALTGPVVIEGGYGEFNGSSSGASQHWETWVKHVVGSGPIRIRDFSFSGTAPAHRITGTAPSRSSSGLRFEDCPIMGTVFADHNNWSPIDCDPTLVVVGSAPQSPIMSPGGIQFGTGANDVRLAFYREPASSTTLSLAGLSTAGTGWATSASNNFVTKTRIGREVFIHGQLWLTVVGSGSVGQIILTNLPNICKAGAGYRSVLAVGGAINLATAIVSIEAVVIPGTNTAALWVRTAAATSARAMLAADLGSGTLGTPVIFAFSGNYPTDDA